MNKKYDFAIIGAGVTGAWIAYELSKYNVSVCVVDKENDAGTGATKANSAIIHAGYDPKPDSLMAKLNVRGNRLVHELAEKMSIPFSPVGSLVVAFDDEGEKEIEKLYKRGIENGVPDMKLLSREETLAEEPELSGDVKGALYAGTAGICSSFEMCLAPLEIAIVNGVGFIRNFKTVSASVSDTEVTITSDGGDKVTASYVINASGVHADEIARLFGDETFGITPRRGEYSILDQNVGGIVSHVIFQPPTKNGKGILVSPTVDGNILVGPTADVIDEKDDRETTPGGQRAVFDGARRSVPAINERDVITSFSGVRPTGNTGDFVIGFSSACGRLFNAACIESPGLTAAPAVGEYTAELLGDAGLLGGMKTDFCGERRVIRFRELPDEEKNELIKKNPAFGRIVCRCETITEGEIADAVTRPCGAADMDGVKRRVRAGMGRCQGGFCGPKVMEIISRELHIPMENVTKKGGGSWMVRDGER